MEEFVTEFTSAQIDPPLAVRYLAHVLADRLLDCRCGGRLPEIRIIGSRSNLDPSIMLANYSGSADPLAAYFMHFHFALPPIW